MQLLKKVPAESIKYIYHKHFRDFFPCEYFSNAYPETGRASPLKAKYLCTEFWVSLEEIYVISIREFQFHLQEVVPMPPLLLDFSILP